MAEDNVERYDLQIVNDESASQASINAVDTIAAKLDNAAASADSLSTAAAAAGETVKSVAEQIADMGVNADQVFTSSGDAIALNLTAQVDNADASVQNLIHDIGDLGRDIESIPEPPLSAFGVDDGGGDSGGGFNITGSRRGLTALGSLAGGSPELGEAARIISVTAAFGPLGLAAGGAALAIKAVTDEETARTKAAQDGADALNKIALGAAGGTTESINQQIAQEEQHKQSLEDAGKQLSYYNSEINSTADTYKRGLISSTEYTSALQQIGTDVSNLTGGAVTAGQAVSGMKQLIDDNNKSIDGVDISLGGLHIQLTSTSVAANDAALAEQELAKQRAAADAQIASSQNKLADDYARAQTLTTDERTKEIKALQDQEQYLLEAKDKYDITGDAAKSLNTEMDGLDNQIAALQDASSGAADAIAAQTAADKLQSTQTDNYFKALADEGTILGKIADLHNQAALDDQEANQKSIELGKKDDADVLQADQDAADKRLQIIQGNADKVAQIEHDAGESERADVGNRDALKFTEDQQKEADQLSAQQKAEDKSLASNDTALTKQLASIEKSYEAQQTVIDDAATKQIETIQQKEAQLDVALQNAEQNQLAIAQYGSGGLVQIEDNLWQSRLSLADAAASALAQVGIGNGGAGAPLGLPLPPGGFPGFLGYTPLPPPSNGGTQGAVGGRVTNIYVNGAGYSLGDIVSASTNHTLGLINTFVNGNGGVGAPLGDPGNNYG